MPASARTVEALLVSLAPEVSGLIDQIVDPDELAGTVSVVGARSLALASSGDVVFCKAATPALLAAAEATAARVLVTTSDVFATLSPEAQRGRVFILTAQPRVVVSALVMPLAEYDRWDRADAEIDSTAALAPGVVIGPGVRIGPRVMVGPNTVLSHVEIGADSIIGANCSIGGQGFGFEPNAETGAVLKVPHFGRIRIGSRVEIFANVAIARGSFDDTVIEDDVKIDNLVHIAHNVHIGRGTLVIANAMIAGSVRIGAGAWIAPSSSVLNGSTIGPRAMTGMGAVVTKSVDENAVVAGVPAKVLRTRYSSPEKS